MSLVENKPNTGTAELNPFQYYASTVLKAKTHIGGGGVMWNEKYRNTLHNEATLFIMAEEKIPVNEENFYLTRERVGKLVEDMHRHNAENGFSDTPGLPPLPVLQLQNGHYVHEGD